MVRWAVVLLIAGCGRIGFAPLGSGDGGGGSDDAPKPTDADLETGLVLDVPFDQPLSGLTTVDLAMAHLIQCPIANCASITAGHTGNAYLFDGGGNSFMTVTYSNDLDASKGFTIALWVRLDSLSVSSFDCFVTKTIGSQDLDSWSLCVDPQSKSLFETSDGALADMVSGPTMAFGTWHHLALTWDRTSKVRTSYFDGVSIDSHMTTITNDTNDLRIAADNNMLSIVYEVNGALDALRLYSRPLSAAEIGALAQ